MSDRGELDRVFAALADPSRRRLLQRLATKPGATTGELASVLPGVTRFAVMKHLAVLRSAGLVTTLPVGRRRRHFRDDAALSRVSSWLRELRGDAAAGRPA